jgi:exosortase
MFFVQPKEQIVSLRPLWWFLFTVAISLIVGWHILFSVFSLAWTNDAYTHILLIIPIAAGFIYLDWPVPVKWAPSWRAAAVFLFLALFVAALENWRSDSLIADEQLSLCTLAIVLWWIGAFVGSFGTRVSKSLLFPLGFLFWLVPFPAFLLNAIVGFLQQGSAYAAQLLFAAVGVPVMQDGIRLTIPGLTVEVAQECSSIRSSMILLVSTMVLAQLFLRSRWRKAFVIAAAVPLSLAKNGLRIFTIAMLGTRVDPAFLTGKLHHNGGVIFLAIALAVIFVLLWILREQRSGRAEGSLRPVISTVRK